MFFLFFLRYVFIASVIPRVTVYQYTEHTLLVR
jgi:hypothetical protein